MYKTLDGLLRHIKHAHFFVHIWSLFSFTVWPSTVMSEKKDKKSKKKETQEKEAIAPEETLDVSLEWVAEPILKGVYKHLAWKEVQGLGIVCRGWKAAITGEVGDEPEYLHKFVEAYPEKDNKVCVETLRFRINAFL